MVARPETQGQAVTRPTAAHVVVADNDGLGANPLCE
jgi:hypothetical protein